jgi:hypothetical protein
MLTGFEPICPALERVSTGPLNLSFFVRRVHELSGGNRLS